MAARGVGAGGSGGDLFVKLLPHIRNAKMDYNINNKRQGHGNRQYLYSCPVSTTNIILFNKSGQC